MGGPSPSLEYGGASSTQSNVNAQALVTQNFLAAVFGVGDTVGFGGDYGLSPGISVPGVTFSGDASSPRYDPKQPISGSVTVNDALAKLASLPKDQMIDWKNRLYDAGLYDPSMYSKGLKPRKVGVLDSEDKKAFRDLILTSLTAPPGTTTQQVLESLQEDSPFSSKNNYGRQPTVRTATVSDPATIRRYAQTAATELLGRSLTDAEEAKLVSKLTTLETESVTKGANAANAMDAAGQGGTIINQGVDVASRAAEEVEAANAGEAQAKKFANGYDVLMRMIGAGR